MGNLPFQAREKRTTIKQWLFVNGTYFLTFAYVATTGDHTMSVLAAVWTWLFTLPVFVLLATIVQFTKKFSRIASMMQECGMTDPVVLQPGSKVPHAPTYREVRTLSPFADAVYDSAILIFMALSGMTVTFFAYWAMMIGQYLLLDIFAARFNAVVSRIPMVEVQGG